MSRLQALALIGTILLTGGCTRATFGYRPSLTSQVPDSTAVRVRPHGGVPPITGRAVGWQTGQPRVLTATGDTVQVPPTATMEVRLENKKTHAVLGGVIGVSVGLSVKLVRCPPPNRCGPDVTPALTAGIGALIGSRFTAVDWVRVRRPPPERPARSD